MEKLREVQLQREEADKFLIAARALCMKHSLTMPQAIERARIEAEREFLLQATTPGSKIRVRILLPRLVS